MKKKTSGLIMAIVGFIMILINALDYIFGWNNISPAFGIIGLIFVAIGMKIKKR
jgi:uncharacterized membrane protein